MANVWCAICWNSAAFGIVSSPHVFPTHSDRGMTRNITPGQNSVCCVAFAGTVGLLIPSLFGPMRRLCQSSSGGWKSVGRPVKLSSFPLTGMKRCTWRIWMMSMIACCMFGGIEWEVIGFTEMPILKPVQRIRPFSDWILSSWFLFLMSFSIASLSDRKEKGLKHYSGQGLPKSSQLFSIIHQTCCSAQLIASSFWAGWRRRLSHR
jgi:hypothetical protein